MIIPFITPIACVWHYPLRVQKKVEHDDMRGMLAMMLGKREEFQQQKDEPRYEDQSFVHWKPVCGPDDLPEDISVRDIRISSLRSDPIAREIVVLDRDNHIIHRHGHTWLRTLVDKRMGLMRGIVAGTTRRPWVAERWMATGNPRGLNILELPVLEAVL